MDIIKVQNLVKTYKEKEAVSGISFVVKEGEIFGFLGPNGAGKTTTIKILTTQLLPTQGEVFVLGNDVRKNPQAIRQKIGVVFEEQNIYPRLTVWQNLKFFAKLYGKGDDKIEEVLGFVQLKDRAKDEAQKLSRGLKQRILIARALIMDPDLIFLDEPTAGLDPHVALHIRELVKNLREQGKTIFLTTHYMEEADELCNRVAIINQGKIVQLDTPTRLKDSIGGALLKLVVYDDVNGGETVETYTPDSRDAAERIRDLIESGIRYKIESKSVSLEDVFIKLTGSKLD